MKLDRLKPGEAIAVIAAVALFVFMFLDWFGAEISGQAGKIDFGAGAGAGGSAWATLDVISFVLMLTVAVTIGAGLPALLDSRWKPAIAPSAAVTDSRITVPFDSPGSKTSSSVQTAGGSTHVP